MFFVDLLFAVVIGALLTMIFAPLFRAEGRWANWAEAGGFLWFFLVIFLASWLGGIRIPVGPRLWGVAWVPVLLTGLLFALLLAATAPVRPPPVLQETLAEAREEPMMDETTFMAINLLYWTLLIALALSIAAYYA
jgi:hypothetical protein